MLECAMKNLQIGYDMVLFDNAVLDSSKFVRNDGYPQGGRSRFTC